MTHPIYLASHSPRRRELLRQIGVRHVLMLLRQDPRRGVDVDETPVINEPADAYAMRVAQAKAEVAAGLLASRQLPLAPVLAADTTVVCDGRMLGKPVDEDEAYAHLQTLSGRQHHVITAVAIALGDRIETASSVSSVWFRELSADEIRRYVATREPLDKAGAYAIQGRAAVFIARIDGSYSGIMGLPLADTAVLLRNFGVEIL
jgi:septum formation protein